MERLNCFVECWLIGFGHILMQHCVAVLRDAASVWVFMKNNGQRSFDAQCVLPLSTTFLLQQINIWCHTFGLLSDVHLVRPLCFPCLPQGMDSQFLFYTMHSRVYLLCVLLGGVIGLWLLCVWWNSENRPHDKALKTPFLQLQKREREKFSSSLLMSVIVIYMGNIIFKCLCIAFTPRGSCWVGSIFILQSIPKM